MSLLKGASPGTAVPAQVLRLHATQGLRKAPKIRAGGRLNKTNQAQHKCAAGAAPGFRVRGPGFEKLPSSQVLKNCFMVQLLN